MLRLGFFAFEPPWPNSCLYGTSRLLSETPALLPPYAALAEATSLRTAAELLSRRSPSKRCRAIESPVSSREPPPMSRPPPAEMLTRRCASPPPVAAPNCTRAAAGALTCPLRPRLPPPSYLRFCCGPVSQAAFRHGPGREPPPRLRVEPLVPCRFRPGRGLVGPLF